MQKCSATEHQSRRRNSSLLLSALGDAHGRIPNDFLQNLETTRQYSPQEVLSACVEEDPDVAKLLPAWLRQEFQEFPLAPHKGMIPAPLQEKLRAWLPRRELHKTRKLDTAMRVIEQVLGTSNVSQGEGLNDSSAEEFQDIVRAAKRLASSCVTVPTTPIRVSQASAKLLTSHRERELRTLSSRIAKSIDCCPTGARLHIKFGILQQPDGCNILQSNAVLRAKSEADVLRALLLATNETGTVTTCSGELSFLEHPDWSSIGCDIDAATLELVPVEVKVPVRVPVGKYIGRAGRGLDKIRREIALALQTCSNGLRHSICVVNSFATAALLGVSKPDEIERVRDCLIARSRTVLAADEAHAVYIQQKRQFARTAAASHFYNVVRDIDLKESGRVAYMKSQKPSKGQSSRPTKPVARPHKSGIHGRHPQCCAKSKRQKSHKIDLKADFCIF